jgi:L-threonylcarbamoyladenylate synthase
MDVIKLNQKAVNNCIEIINEGGVVVFPTDTVYGFLADAGNKKAVDKIYKIKKRPKSKPLAVFVKDLKMANGLAEISEKQEKILKSKWPGKYTFVLNKKDDKGTIALRIPKHKFLNSLLKKINKPLVQTSVNISGEPVLSKISDIIEKFATSDVAMLMVDGGNLGKRGSSRIIDLTSKSLTRLR